MGVCACVGGCTHLLEATVSSQISHTSLEASRPKSQRLPRSHSTLDSHQNVAVSCSPAPEGGHYRMKEVTQNERSLRHRAVLHQNLKPYSHTQLPTKKKNELRRITSATVSTQKSEGCTGSSPSSFMPTLKLFLL